MWLEIAQTCSATHVVGMGTHSEIVLHNDQTQHKQMNTTIRGILMSMTTLLVSGRST